MIENVRPAISNAYYEARNEGETMETAADRAAVAVYDVVEQRLKLHEPEISYGYEEFKCSCGWDIDDDEDDGVIHPFTRHLIKVLTGRESRIGGWPCSEPGLSRCTHEACRPS